MDELDLSIVLGDVSRIAAALAADTDNDNAQGDAADLNAAAAWLRELTPKLNALAADLEDTLLRRVGDHWMPTAEDAATVERVISELLSLTRD